MNVKRPSGQALRRLGRRRRPVVDPEFQWKAAGTIVVTVFFVCTLMGALQLLALHEQARAQVLNEADPQVSTLWQSPGVPLVGSMAYALVLAVAIGVWSILLTNRVCGPVHVVEGMLNDLEKGRLPNRRPIRKTDAFQGFYASFWRTIDAQQARRAEDRADVEEMLELVDRAAREPARREHLASLERRLRQLHERLGNGSNAQVGGSLAPAGHRNDPLAAVPELVAL